ncbi:MAG: C40 family peptidase [Bacteroidales bacterium]|nr:C40 family peptidase [Bacteroidales bacterium]
MKFGIVPTAFTPVRQDPSEQSEQITQLLFGELCEIHNDKKNWYYIRSAYDNYEGWIDQKMISLLDETTYKNLLQSKPFIISEPFSSVTRDGSMSHLIVPSGSAAYQFQEKEKSFTNGTNKYRFEQEPSPVDASSLTTGIEETAETFINTPYLWGGKSTFGCDCSGLVQTVFKIYGMVLPRDTAEQVNSGETLPFLNDAKSGDLAFFDNEEGEIIHVGILLDKKRIIHASGQVRLDAIDQEGIYNKELGRYTHKLRTIKKIVN